jgi:hypothetical protein
VLDREFLPAVVLAERVNLFRLVLALLGTLLVWDLVDGALRLGDLVAALEKCPDDVLLFHLLSG